MEEYTIFIEMVNRVGFPILACGALYNLVNKNNDRNNEQLDKITQAVNNNTIVLKEITTLLNKEGDEK